MRKFPFKNPLTVVAVLVSLLMPMAVANPAHALVGTQERGPKNYPLGDCQIVVEYSMNAVRDYVGIFLQRGNSVISEVGGGHWYHSPTTGNRQIWTTGSTKTMSFFDLYSCDPTVLLAGLSLDGPHAPYDTDKISLTFWHEENGALVQKKFELKDPANWGDPTPEFLTTTILDDLEAPVISNMPADITLYTDATSTSAVATWTAPTATDNIGILDFTSNYASGASFPVGTTTVTYNARDTSYQAAAPKSFTVTVIDGGAPTITVGPQIITSTVSGPTIPVTLLATVSDAVDGTIQPVFKVNGNTITSPHAFGKGAHTVAVTASDAAGNAAPPKSVTVLVSDRVKPVVTPPADQNLTMDVGKATAALDVAGLGSVIDEYPISRPAFYDIGGVRLDGSYDFPAGETIVEMGATDDSFNLADPKTFKVIVTDAEAPVLTAPADQSILTNLGAAVGTLDVTSLGSVSDNTGTSPAISYAIGSTPLTGPHAFPAGDTTVSMAATDAAGNQANPVTFKVTVADGEKPVITAPADQSIATDTGLSTAALDVTSMGSASDNLDPALTLTYAVPGAPLTGSYNFPIGATTVTMDATDVAGNIATTQSFVVTVTDNQPPVIGSVPNIALTTDAGKGTAAFDVTTLSMTTDNSGVASTVIHKLGTTVLTGSYDFPVGINLIEITATDAAGNAATPFQFTVKVSDTEAPLFANLPENIDQVTDAGAQTAVVTFAAPTATDNTDGPISPVLVSSPTAGLDSGSAFPLGVTTMTYTATDAAGNAPTASFTITITDAEKPVIAPIENIETVTAPLSELSADVSFAATVSDNVDAPASFAPVFSVGDAIITSPHRFGVGVTTVTVTVNEDSAKNFADPVTFTVTVADDEAPVFTNVPADFTQDTDAGFATAVVTFDTPVATDNVDGDIAPVLVSSPTPGLVSGSAFPLGVTSMTYTATDAAGNAPSVSFTITIGDAEAPVIAAPEDITVETDAGVATASLDVTTLGSVTDAVDAELLITYQFGETVLSGPYDFALGETIVTMDATDSAGNVADQVSFKVTVFDDTPPAPPANITVVVNDDGSVTVSGTAEDGSTVEITFPDGSVLRQYIGILTANARAKATTSAFAITSNGKQPAGATTVVVIDPAGNRSTATSMMMTPTASVAEIQENILGYMQARATHVVRAQPDLIGMLSGVRSGGLNANVTKDGGSFDFKSSADWPVWAQAEGSWSKGDGAENSYYMGAFGAHYTINPNAIIGAMVTFDQLTQTNGDTSTEGTGYLVGPYFVAKLPNQPLFLEARYLIGKSTNTVSVDGTLPETFETNRTLASVKVAGQVQYGKTTFTPSLTATHLSDIQAAFIDDVNRQIGAQTVTVNDVAFGLDFATPVSLASGDLTLMGGMSGIWSETTSSADAPASDGLRMRVHAGFSHAMDNGVTLSANGFYDGIGADDYEGWGVSVGLEMTF